MPLIKCPDCGNTVSDKSEVCLKCGRPIAKLSSPSPVQTIEKTSKKLKGWLLTCGMALAFSVLLMMIGGAAESDFLMGTSVLMFLVSAGGFVTIKFKIWWEHE